MAITFLCGDRTGSFGLAGLWAVEDDEKENGGKRPITFKMIQGANHFVCPLCIATVNVAQVSWPIVALG
jgi:hypothetical protein